MARPIAMACLTRRLDVMCEQRTAQGLTAGEWVPTPTRTPIEKSTRRLTLRGCESCATSGRTSYALLAGCLQRGRRIAAGNRHDWHSKSHGLWLYFLCFPHPWRFAVWLFELLKRCVCWELSVTCEL